MTIALLAIATFLAFAFVQLVYVVAQAIVGWLMGATVEAIAVGFGPNLWCRSVSGVEWRIGAIPAGGYTKFLGQDDLEEWEQTLEGASDGASRTPFKELPILGRLLLVTIGPITNLALGLVLVLIPIVSGANQVVVNPQANVPIEPHAVPNLGVSDEPASWTGQVQLLHDTFLELWRRVVSFESKEGWGTFVGSLVTCAAAGAISPNAWASCFGVLCLGLGLLNLFPLPTLNGGHIVILAIEAVFGRPPERAVILWTWIGMLIVLPTMIYLLIIDVCWCMGELGF